MFSNNQNKNKILYKVNLSPLVLFVDMRFLLIYNKLIILKKFYYQLKEIKVIKK